MRLKNKKDKNITSREKIPGGLSSGKNVSDYEWDSLYKGIQVEMEHTTDINIAKEIAMDHLEEDPQYYEKLEKIERQ